MNILQSIAQNKEFLSLFLPLFRKSEVLNLSWGVLVLQHNTTYQNVTPLATVWSISSQSNDWPHTGLIYYFHYQHNNQLSTLTSLHFILKTLEFCKNPKYVNSSGCVAPLICCKRIIHKLQRMLYFSDIRNIKLTYKWKIRNRTSTGKGVAVAETMVGWSRTLHENNKMYCTLNVHTKLHLHNYIQCQLQVLIGLQLS